jgi:Xaa-Pro aminopeptidase
MTRIKLVDLELPDFGVPREQPELPRSLYDLRLQAFSSAVEKAGLNAAVIYADREHSANFCYLTGFDPRFEESLLIVAKGMRPVILTGPENHSAALDAAIDAEAILYPPFGLLGQDRSKTRPLREILRESGLGNGMRIGVIGWKYYGAAETENPETWIEAPAFVVDVLRLVAGDVGAVVNAGRLMMDCTKGLRAFNEIEQLAFFEFSAAHASEAVKRAIFGLRPGQTEFELAAAIGLTQCSPVGSGQAVSRAPAERSSVAGIAFRWRLGIGAALPAAPVGSLRRPRNWLRRPPIILTSLLLPILHAP